MLTSNVAVNVFINACGWECGAGLTWLVVINLFFAGVASVAVTGRITFALLRDKAFPYSDYLVQVHPTLKSPIRAINFVFILDALLLLLGLNPASGTAFTAIVGLCTIGFMVSYAIPIVLKIVCQPKNFPDTPMAPGRWSVPCGIASSVWLLGTSCLFLFPQAGPLDLDTMNWLVVICGGCFVMGAVYWLAGGNKSFTGPPIMNIKELLAEQATEELNPTWSDVEGDDKHAQTEEYLQGQFIDAAAEAKKRQEATFVSQAVSTAQSLGSSVAEVVTSGGQGAVALAAAGVQGLAAAADETLAIPGRVVTTGKVMAGSTPKTLSHVFTPAGAVPKSAVDADAEK